MPIVTIQQSPNYSKDQRKLLIKKITEAFEEAYDAKPESVTVFFQNYDAEHWGKAGKLRSEKSGS